ncbi:MAG: glycine cleavage system aminomethyltransferase GcvT [Balneolales bacterium]
MIKKTPLYEIHRVFRARLVDFSGFEMPQQYTSIKDEHIAVRKSAGLFDVSHMGEILISGNTALEVVQQLTVNDASVLKPGKVQYSMMCKEDGGIVDDLLVYCLSGKEYMLVVNASNIKKDLAWIMKVNNGRAEVSDISDETVLIALQGPKAVKILNEVSDEAVVEIPPFEFRSMTIAGYDNILVSATGYTGENGYELYCNIRHVNVTDLWETIMLIGDKFDLKPCGIAARDTLRLEAGLLLYGNDLSEDVTPLEAGVEWLVKWDKGDFIGKESLLELKKNGIRYKLFGLVMSEGKRIPRKGYPVKDNNGNLIGEVTSGGLSIVLDRGIAMAYLLCENARLGDTVLVVIRNSEYAARIVRLPFYKKDK